MAQLVLVNMPLSVTGMAADEAFNSERTSEELRLLAAQELMFLWIGTLLSAVNIMQSRKEALRKGPSRKPILDKDGKLKELQEDGRPEFEADGNW